MDVGFLFYTTFVLLTCLWDGSKSTPLSIFRPTPRPGGYLQIKVDVKEKKNNKVQFDQYKNIISRVEDMEKDKYRVEKTVIKNPIPPTITPIRNLNLPKISQESLFDKCLIENEDNGK